MENCRKFQRAWQKNSSVLIFFGVFPSLPPHKLHFSCPSISIFLPSKSIKSVFLSYFSKSEQNILEIMWIFSKFYSSFFLYSLQPDLCFLLVQFEIVLKLNSYFWIHFYAFFFQFALNFSVRFYFFNKLVALKFFLAWFSFFVFQYYFLNQALNFYDLKSNILILPCFKFEFQYFQICSNYFFEWILVSQIKF